MNNQSDYFIHSKVVICIPVFNEEKFIYETLSSVIQQTWKDFIVVISDNASTDKTAIICQEICSIDSRFYYIRQETNIGASANFYYLYKNSTSPYFMWLGAHDLLDTEFLSTHINILDKTDEYFLSYSSTQWVNEESKDTHITSSSDLDDIQGIPLVRYLKSINIINECTAINQLIRRNALENHTLASCIKSDHIILSRILYMGKIHKVNTPLYKRRAINIRSTEQIERITGKKGLAPDIHAFIYAHLKDFDKLEKNFLVKVIFRPIIYLILKDRFIGIHGRVEFKVINILKRVINYF